MGGPSDEVLYRTRTGEVTSVFHSRKALELAVQDLLMAGADRADIDISASSENSGGAPATGRRLSYQVIPPAALPMAPRLSFTDPDDLIATAALAGSVGTVQLRPHPQNQ
jgi:hypothetical protein